MLFTAIYANKYLSKKQRLTQTWVSLSIKLSLLDGRSCTEPPIQDAERRSANRLRIEDVGECGEQGSADADDAELHLTLVRDALPHVGRGPLVAEPVVLVGQRPTVVGVDAVAAFGGTAVLAGDVAHQLTLVVVARSPVPPKGVDENQAADHQSGAALPLVVPLDPGNDAHDPCDDKKEQNKEHHRAHLPISQISVVHIITFCSLCVNSVLRRLFPQSE